MTDRTYSLNDLLTVLDQYESILYKFRKKQSADTKGGKSNYDLFLGIFNEMNLGEEK